MSLAATAWQRLEALFHQACQLPAAEREAFARAQVGDDASVRDQLLAMLAVESQATLRVRAPLKQAAAACVRRYRNCRPARASVPGRSIA